MTKTDDTSEREHSDGRCCENGYFGQQHNCMKSSSGKREPMEWWIYSEQGHSDHVAWGIQPKHKDAWKYVHVVEKSAFDALAVELERTKATRDDYRKQLEDYEWKVEASLRAELTETKAQINDLLADQDALKAKLAEKDTELDQAKAEIERLVFENKRLSVLVGDNDIADSKLARKTNIELDKCNGKLKSQLQQANETIADLKAECERYKDAARDSICKLDLYTTQTNETIAKLKEQIKNTAMFTAKAYEDEIVDLKFQVQDKSSSLENYKEMVKNNLSVIASLRAEVEKLKNPINTCEDELTGIKREFKKLHAQYVKVCAEGVESIRFKEALNELDQWRKQCERLAKALKIIKDNDTTPFGFIGTAAGIADEALSEFETFKKGLK
jgi:chromosome segregation ATPase